MWLKEIELQNIRCFNKRTALKLSPKINIIVGPNNSGKSTIINAVMALQAPQYLDTTDRRHKETHAFVAYQFGETNTSKFSPNFTKASSLLVRKIGSPKPSGFEKYSNISSQTAPFRENRPKHLIVPFLSNRQTSGFREEINQDTQQRNDGTYSNLYSQIDRLVVAGHPHHEKFKKYISEIIGLQITTAASKNGKKAGFYFDENSFVAIDQMGSGIAELSAMITALCTEKKKIILMEEPETNLHPTALKALLGMIRESSENNQFIITTHSNIVVRELGSESETNIMETYKTTEKPTAPSEIRHINRTPIEHQELLQKLGYEFSDMGLYKGWLFLEESSAERIVRDILIPNFAPELEKKLRTYSAGGVDNIEPSLFEFLRLITFVHLEPIYNDKMWIIADGDNSGIKAIEQIKSKFPYLVDKAHSLDKKNFEEYFPCRFQEKASVALSKENKQEKRDAKRELLMEVLEWTKRNTDIAINEWQSSAAEPISRLCDIEKELA